MTSRTFPLSRQRRRRIPPAPSRTSETAEPAARAGAQSRAPPLPHERDEHADPPQPPRDPIVQAEADLAEGRVDTDRRGDVREIFENALSRRR